ncbi:hypothetical protein LCGC14_0693140 [marine sediment metagenome]|uniref:Uncharacterized protein n=1 Tax=marine sediment metagenome TaxID=412755 RepID=A0A0F9TSU0_9ZZZZ
MLAPRYRRWPSHRAWRDCRYGRKVYMTPERRRLAAMFQFPTNIEASSDGLWRVGAGLPLRRLTP